MNKKELYCTILAAGMGKRMKSNIPKVLHKVKNTLMIVKLINEAVQLNPYKIIIVVGKYKNIIEETINKYINISNIVYVFQKEPMGTANAILYTLNLLNDDCINLILNGDNPLISNKLMNDAINNFIQNNNQIQLTAIDSDNSIKNNKIVFNNNNNKFYEKNEEKEIKLVNRSMYVISTTVLKQYIPFIKNNNIQKEYYLPDIVKVCSGTNITIGLFKVDKDKEIELVNINTKEELDRVNHILKCK